MDKDLSTKYEAVIADQEAAKARLMEELQRLQTEVQQVDAVIAGLRAAITISAEARSLVKPLPFLTPIGVATANADVPVNKRYAGISVRWAVLCLMAEYAQAPMTSPEIAAELEAGGVRSSGQKFTANVSAVVSDMAKNRYELTVDDGKYQITQKGREAWTTIKRSRSYRFRVDYRHEAAHAQ